jgi:IrrE N-terminal-like domain
MSISAFGCWLREHFGTAAEAESADVARHCEQLLTATGVDDPPTSLTAVARLLGLEAKPSFRPQAEMGILAPEEARIYLRRAPNEVIRTGSARHLQLRFTYAHELGHALLYDFSRRPGVRLAPFPDNSKEEREEEEFCNRVAAHLLMPDFLLVNTFPSGRAISGESLRAAARTYNVSLLAMAVRAKEIFRNRLDTGQFGLLSGEISNRESLGPTKPRCAACFLPPELQAAKVHFLATHQGIEHVFPAQASNPAWSLQRFFQLPARRRPLHSQTETELLKCQSRHVVQLTSQHHRLIGCRYVWTEGTIRLS